jgi:hypothetical protein
MYKCGVDLKDFDALQPLRPKPHYATRTSRYFSALNIMLHRHDPGNTISPCDVFRDDPVHGLRATLKAYLRDGKFPY